LNLYEKIIYKYWYSLTLKKRVHPLFSSSRKEFFMSLTSGNILLADDEETFLEATQDLLQDEGYHCHTVRNAKELGQALQNTPDLDLLITDLNMPGNRVLELVREIRSQSAQLPVIIVTGYPSIPTAVESIHLHVLEYLIKPVDYPALLAAIKHGLQQKRVLRSVQQARKEAASRVERLAKIEETLKTWSTTITDPEVEKILLTDPGKKELPLPWARSSPILEHTLPPPNSSSIPSTDYLLLREALFETIQVLQKTKSAFRSKDLAALRQKLEAVLAQTKETFKYPSFPAD
jgi:DNA-binding response OmpR family regulator